MNGSHRPVCGLCQNEGAYPSHGPDTAGSSHWLFPDEPALVEEPALFCAPAVPFPSSADLPPQAIIQIRPRPIAATPVAHLVMLHERSTCYANGISTGRRGPTP